MCGFGRMRHGYHLALKAKLHLYDESVRIPDPELKDKWIGCEEHHAFTKQAADECITLVKDTKQLIPVDARWKKRAYLVYVQSTPQLYQSLN